jgi:hypothetical protein
MTLFVVGVNGKPRTFRTFLEAAGVISVLRIILPDSRLTFKRVRLPSLP